MTNAPKTVLAIHDLPGFAAAAAAPEGAEKGGTRHDQRAENRISHP